MWFVYLLFRIYSVDSSPLRTTCIQYQFPTKIPCSLFMVRTLLFINPPHPLDLAVAPPCSHNIYNAALFIRKHFCINSKLIFLVSVGVSSWNMVKTSCIEVLPEKLFKTSTSKSFIRNWVKTSI